MVGAPVIIKHQDVTEENADELRCGAISEAYFSEPDGWYYCEGVIWDKKAQELIEKGWSVSCSYDFLSFKDEKGIENNIPYDKEFTSLNFTHLALVDNPRYEKANIVFNAKIENYNENHDDEGKFAAAPESFGNSQIKDADGKLLDVYHGSDVDFDNFDEKLEHHFFSSEFTVGKSYATPKSGRIYTANLNLQNPLVIEAKGNSWANINDRGLRTTAISKYAKENGYDGVIVKDVMDIGKRYYKHNWAKEEIDILEKPHTDYIVFDPKNIHIKAKSVIDNVNNAKEQDMLLDELKKLITKVENNKENDEMIENEKEDKRKLIDEVGGILKGKVDEEVWRTIIGKLEKLSYEKSEDGTADNKKVKNEDDKPADEKADVENKKVKNEDDEKAEKVDNEEEEKDEKEVKELKEDVKEDVDNKCKNAKPDTTSFDKINAIYNSVKQIEQEKTYISRQEKLDNAVEYFK